MDSKPLVSVLMTAYNREDFIAKSIESVLTSTYTNFELIILDDCSTDKTVEIAQQFAQKDKRVKVFVNTQNLGELPNRDKIVTYAAGTYIKYVDSDDLMYENGLQIMVEGMLKFPNAVFGLSQFRIDINKDEVYPTIISSERAYQEHFYGYGTLNYGPIGAIIKKKVLIEMGGFGTNRFIGDTELWLKLVAKYQLVKMQPDLVKWVRHEGQEFNYGVKNGFFIKKAYHVYLSALHSPNCPLNQADILQIKKRLQWKHARDILSLVFKKGKFTMGLQIYRDADLNFVQLLKGLLPYSFVKKKFIKKFESNTNIE
jgi:glycosyltransferase involved in cell wall biosynthesis